MRLIKKAEKAVKDTENTIISECQLPQLFKEAVIRPEDYLFGIKKYIGEIKKDFLGKNLTAESYVDLLNTFFTKKYAIEFKYEENAKINNNAVPGLCNAAILDDDRITILLVCNKSLPYLFRSDYDFSKFEHELISILGHEVIHREQELKIKSADIRRKLIVNYSKIRDSLKSQDPKEWDIFYKSNKKEIMAFSWSIIEDLRYHKKTDEEILEIIQHISRKDVDIFFYNMMSSALASYISLFKNRDEPLKTLYKYIYEYLRG